MKSVQCNQPTTIQSGDPLSAHVQCEWELTVGREDWYTKLVTNSEMTADLTTFYLENQMTAYHDGEQIFTRTWKEEIPRNFKEFSINNIANN